jgi:glutamate-1-semialdehyde aminotransferase
MKEPPKLKLDKTFEAFEIGSRFVPGGTLGIRRPYNFVEGEYPIFFDHGKGGRVTDIDGNDYIDYLCAYGPIILGYREEEVDEAVIRQIRDKGFCFSLTQTYQNDLAAKLRELVPCGEMFVFVKTGSDAMTTAVRLARSYTGRDKVLRNGYHGWHDWCVEVKGGIPQKLYEDVHEFRYNDLNSLEDLLKQHGDNTAAITLTPFGHPTAKPMAEPAPGFLQGVRALADKYGVVLIFDEVRTCFRVSMGGAQQYYGVTPDLACIGKAMANGYAISAVCGKAGIMKKGEHDVFISSTFFPNSLGYVASLKTIEILQRDNVLKAIWAKGAGIMSRVRGSIDSHPVGAELSGIAPMFFVTFKADAAKLYRKRRNEFYTQLIRRGVFMQPYHHAYICYRHTEEDLAATAQAVEDALAIVEEKYGKYS